MPATPNGDFEAVLAGEINGVNRVGSAAAAGNQGWVLVNEPVVDLSGIFVPDISRAQYLSREAARKFCGNIITQ